MGYKIHTIKKGNHRTSNPTIGLHWKKSMLSYMVNFDDSCKYRTKETYNQSDINKLFGLSFGFHHENSARFGWRYNIKEDVIDVVAYIYRNGDRVNEWAESIHIGKVKTNTDYIFDLDISGGYYLFIIKSVDGKNILDSKLSKTGNLPPWGYYLNPYFGGDETAPHTMKIKLFKLL